MSTRTVCTSTLLALIAGLVLHAALSERAHAAPLLGAQPGPGQRDIVLAGLLEGWGQLQTGQDSFPISGPGLVSQRSPSAGTLLVRGAPDFIYDGILTVVNVGDSQLAFALTDGTVLMTVPAGGSSTLRPFVAFPPNELTWTAEGGSFVEFAWVIRPH